MAITCIFKSIMSLLAQITFNNFAKLKNGNTQKIRVNWMTWRDVVKASTAMISLATDISNCVSLKSAFFFVQLFKIFDHALVFYQFHQFSYSDFIRTDLLNKLYVCICWEWNISFWKERWKNWPGQPFFGGWLTDSDLS